MKRLILLIFCSLFLGSGKILAQSEAAAIKEVIRTMFDGMREGDSAKVHSAFTDEVLMQTIITNRQGQTRVNNGSLRNFLKAVGTPHDEVWDEKILDYTIHIDGAMASVWTPYEFYLGDSFSHCGVNSFQLFKSEEGWKIIYLVDTRRKQTCKAGN